MNIKEYILKTYRFGVWRAVCSVCAESDNEAIHDTDEILNGMDVKNYRNPVVLFLNNRKIKSYN